jgi:hypothetical protein
MTVLPTCSKTRTNRRERLDAQGSDGGAIRNGAWWTARLMGAAMKERPRVFRSRHREVGDECIDGRNPDARRRRSHGVVLVAAKLRCVPDVLGR